MLHLTMYINHKITNESYLVLLAYGILFYMAGSLVYKSTSFYEFSKHCDSLFIFNVVHFEELGSFDKYWKSTNV